MRLTKIDLTDLVAIGHDHDCLELLLDRGSDLEQISVPAPVEAYEGLQELEAFITDPPLLPSALERPQLPPSDLVDRDRANQTNGPDRRPVRSTMATAVGYDAADNRLQVEFKNGAVYEYQDVDEATWTEFWESDSIGTFFNEEIKGHYPTRRISC